MRARPFFLALSLALSAVCLAAPGLGQTTFGTILGTVSDPSGAVMPDVLVTVTNQGENISREVHCDAQGNYQAENLKAGLYTVTVRASSFRPITAAPAAPARIICWLFSPVSLATRAATLRSKERGPIRLNTRWTASAQLISA